MHNILVSDKKKTGLFTSPFVTETIEKYKINNHLISARDFISIVNEIKPAINDCAENSRYGIPSYFEICFAIAMLYFVKNKCQYVVSEVGCGGEFDATNIIKRSKITIITHVDYDHTHILGNTLAKIATTKSKIIKPKTIFLTTEKRSHVRSIFINECKKQNAKYNLVKPNILNPIQKSGKFIFDYKNETYKLNMSGQHQADNAVLAIEAAKKIGIKEASIKKGIEKTKIPARFEIVRKNPTIVIDVAHNPDKIKTTLDNLGLLNYRKLHVVYASAANKDIEKISKIISPFVDYLYVTKYFVSLRKCADPKLIKKYWSKYNKKIKTDMLLDPYKALELAQKKSKSKDCILILGSFFLAGELRKNWRSNEKIIRTRKII
jgi:dihydrofolate synthase/folylpolyglutamate synthase